MDPSWECQVVIGSHLRFGFARRDHLTRRAFQGGAGGGRGGGLCFRFGFRLGIAGICQIVMHIPKLNFEHIGVS